MHAPADVSGLGPRITDGVMPAEHHRIGPDQLRLDPQHGGGISCEPVLDNPTAIDHRPIDWKSRSPARRSQRGFRDGKVRGRVRGEDPFHRPPGATPQSLFTFPVSDNVLAQRPSRTRRIMLDCHAARPGVTAGLSLCGAQASGHRYSQPSIRSSAGRWITTVQPYSGGRFAERRRVLPRQSPRRQTERGKPC
jgi:hypothetical protein